MLAGVAYGPSPALRNFKKLLFMASVLTREHPVSINPRFDARLPRHILKFRNNTVPNEAYAVPIGNKASSHYGA